MNEIYSTYPYVRPGETTTDLPNPKDAFGMKKIPLRFVPWAAVAHLARVMRGGAAKYGWMNWRRHKVLRSVYIEAALRHLMALSDGEDFDPESGERHEAHVMACMAILLDAGENRMLLDDRPADGPFGRLVREWAEKSNDASAPIAAPIRLSGIRGDDHQSEAEWVAAPPDGSV